MANSKSIHFVRTLLADNSLRRPHNANMARRGIPKGPISWYLREWMAARGIEKQSEMMALTNWSKATMSQLYNGLQDYSPKIIREAAEALKVAQYELLMHPEEANAIRRLRQEALRVVEAAKALPTVETRAEDERRSSQAS